MARRPFPRGGIRTRLPVTIYRRSSDEFSPTEIEGLALWLDASSTDSLYTTDAGPVTAVASPLDIATPALWLDGADSSAASMTLDGTAVSSWRDKSGNGRDFTASGTARPTLTASGLNGKSVVTFDGSNDQLTNATNVVGFSSVTMFAVVYRQAGTYGGIITSTSADNTPALIIENSNIAVRGYGQISLNTGGFTGPAVVCGRVNAGATEIFTDGLVRDSDAASGSLGSVTTTAIGTYRLAAANYLNGYIAEIIVYPTALSTTDRARVEAYLAAKWGISGVHAPATASSDPVGYWGDKSGNGRHAVATAGSRPSRSVAINTRSAVLLGNATTQRLTVNGVYMDALGDDTNKRITIFAALQSSSQSQQKSIGEVDQGSGFGCYHNISNIAYFDAGAGAPASRASGALASSVITGGAIFSGRRDGGAVDQWYNGALIAGSLTSATGSLRTAGDNPFSVKAVNSGSLAYGEVLVYNRALTTAERQRAERYLAARWGITLAPQVSNADAQDWINRVYANGGTVSSATAASVNQLCDSLDAASLRDRFYRLNLFCGSNLNAALVPLYRGPSLGGTQYGGATDTNEGGLFVTANYNETGVSGGLQGASASLKRLRTGLAQNTMPTGDLHLAAYEIAKSNASSDTSVGARNNSLGQYSELAMGANTSTTTFYNVGTGFASASDSGYTQAGGFLLGVSASTALTLYKNGSSAATGTVSAAASTSSTFAVFSTENESGTGADFTNARLGGYSIGLSMTAGQAAAYNTAMQSFQAALTRDV